MIADHLSYQRARTVSLTGLALQALLGTLLLLYALIVGDEPALTGSLAILCGIPIWIALAVVFHQHRLERLEAMELEAFESSAAAEASVFETARAEEQPQARRLVALHKWFLPGVSIVVAVLLAGIGLVRLLRAQNTLRNEGAFPLPDEQGWAMAIGVALVIVGFVAARFVAGMAKQKAWMLLHAGSAGAVGAAMIGAGIAVANFIDQTMQAGSLLRYLDIVFALFMIVLGIEMALNFLLNLYRPRKAGEYQRPAFDSRVLAFIAAPDRLAESISDAINYQFGFNVSSTWFYRLLARSVLSLALLGVLVVWALSVFTVVKPEERGLLLINGKFQREVGPGLVVSWPWPWSRVDRFPAESVNQIRVGSNPPEAGNPILWTNEHSDVERFFLVQPASVSIDSAGAASDSDLNLISAEFPISYVVTDLRSYKELAQDARGDDVDQIRRDLLEAIASSVIIEYMATQDVDAVLGSARRQMAEDLRGLIQEAFDTQAGPLNSAGRPAGAGVEVMFVGVAGVQPEKEVAAAFEEVVAADQLQLTLIEQAEADAIRTLAGVVGDVDRANTIIDELNALDRIKTAGADAESVALQEQRVLDLIIDAGGEAAVLVSQARAERWRQHMGTAARAVSINGQIASYRAAPGPFRVARYIEALREAAQAARVYISTVDGVRIRLNQEEQTPIMTGFDLDGGDQE